MHAIIYDHIIDEKGERFEIRMILNSNVNPDNWSTPEDSTLTYKNCTNEEDLIYQLDILDSDWKTKFEAIYVKK